ncbi:MAG: response regulator [Anaerolineales bacterium]
MSSIPCLLLVDDHREVTRLLRSTLDTLGHDLRIVEVPSGEEALLEISRRKVDLLVVDYRLPGMNGVELIEKARARQPDIKVIIISAVQEAAARQAMRKINPIAIFDKPIPLGDFLNTVERALGLQSVILPEEESEEVQRQSIAEALSRLRQDSQAHCVYLISERGRVIARAGDLPDTSMEVSLLSALMAIYSAGLKIARLFHSAPSFQIHAFQNEQFDLVFLPVDTAHALLLVGPGLAAETRLGSILRRAQDGCEEIEQGLKSLGVAPLPEVAETTEEATPATMGVPTQNLEELLHRATQQKITLDADSFWEQAAAKHSNLPVNPDVISYEQARRLGLVSDTGEDE